MAEKDREEKQGDGPDEKKMYGGECPLEIEMRGRGGG